jgi:hypothetical protein
MSGRGFSFRNNSELNGAAMFVNCLKGTCHFSCAWGDLARFFIFPEKRP